MQQQVIKSQDLKKDIQLIVESIDYDKVFLLTDTNSLHYCLPLMNDVNILKEAGIITIEAGDQHKHLEALATIWAHLSRHGATRKSLMLNLGGGMVTDLGGFAAATFKRGIRFINIPTTLLGAVDAAVGGKTGINFQGLKNEIGAFASAEVVLIDTNFFKTLDHFNLLSGYAEMLKHSLLKDEKEWERVIAFDVDSVDYDVLKDLLVASVQVKEEVVKKDPYERNLRKALNLGHTVGHAFESLSYEVEKPALHGYAVAWGMVCELYLSYKLCGFPQEKLVRTTQFIKENYAGFLFSCKLYDRLFELMKHDKKNEGNDVNFTLLEEIGQIKINCIVGKEEIFEALDFCRESFGL